MDIGQDLYCCGLAEIGRLQDHEGDPQGALQEFFFQFYQPSWKDPVWGNTAERFKLPAHVIFTQADHQGDDCSCDEWDDDCELCSAVDKTYGEDFATFITQQKLGSIVRSEAARNPNSGNNVICWVWTPNRDAVLEFCRPKEDKKK